MISCSSFFKRITPAAIELSQSEAGRSVRKPLLHSKKEVTVAQTQDGEKWLDSRYILQATPIRFANSCNVGCEESGMTSTFLA